MSEKLSRDLSAAIYDNLSSVKAGVLETVKEDPSLKAKQNSIKILVAGATKVKKDLAELIPESENKDSIKAAVHSHFLVGYTTIVTNLHKCTAPATNSPEISEKIRAAAIKEIESVGKGKFKQMLTKAIDAELGSEEEDTE